MADVSFSCKRRGFCPSCCGRRMAGPPQPDPGAPDRSAPLTPADTGYRAAGTAACFTYPLAASAARLPMVWEVTPSGWVSGEAAPSPRMPVTRTPAWAIGPRFSHAASRFDQGIQCSTSNHSRQPPRVEFVSIRSSSVVRIPNDGPSPVRPPSGGGAAPTWHGGSGALPSSSCCRWP